MSTHVQLIDLAYLKGIVYAFDEAGEGLKMHDHPPDAAHDVNVVSGSCIIYGDVPEKVLRKGESLRFDWSKPHEIVALEDHTVLFNAFLNGIPEQYKVLPPHLRVATFEDTLQLGVNYGT
jgi:hypothetical protein